MTSTDAFALQHSDLNGFLFAEVGVEPRGMTLSVLSALARLGMDPWQDARRLAKLPRTAAVDGLARVIAAMPASNWGIADATAIARRLVALLPVGEGIGPVAVRVAPRMARSWAASGTTMRWALAFALLLAVLSGLLFNFAGRSNADLDAPSSFMSAKPALTAPAAHAPAGG